jgi:hypothetical protein
LVVQTRAATESQSGSLKLFREDGTPAGDLQLKAGVSVLTTAGGRIFVSTSNGVLKAIHRDGTVEALDSPGTLMGIGGLVASPDGKRWAWAAQTRDTTSQSIFVAGDGVAPRTLATYPYPTVLQALAWTQHGVIFDSLPPDYFGYKPLQIAFGAFGGARMLDPNTGAIQVIGTPSQCAFGDEAADGTIACFPASANRPFNQGHSLRLLAPNGHVSNFSLAVPRFNYIGDAYFSPDGTMVTVGGATGAAFSGPATAPSTKPEVFATDLIQISDGSISRFGPTGTRPAMGPQSWLPDGRLVLWRPDSVGGPPGLYVLDPHGSGQGSEILVSGQPVGFLTG